MLTLVGGLVGEDFGRGKKEPNFAGVEAFLLKREIIELALIAVVNVLTSIMAK